MHDTMKLIHGCVMFLYAYKCTLDQFKCVSISFKPLKLHFHRFYECMSQR